MAFRLHGLAGLVFATLFGAMFLLGTLAVFGPEINRLVHPQTRAGIVEGAPVPLGAAYDSLRARYPDHAVVSIIRDPSGAAADQIHVRAPDGGQALVWADPATGALTGSTAYMTAHRILRELHSRFFVLNNYGLLLATSLSVVLALSLVTGVLSHRNLFRTALRRPRGGSDPRARSGAWHRFCAAWALPVLAVACLTGIFYLAELLGAQADLPAPARAAARDAILPGTFDGAALDRAVAKANEVYPDLEIVEVQFPAWRGEGITLRGLGTALLVRPRANAVTVDPATFETLGHHRGEDLSLARRVTEAADPIHFGTWGGLPSRLLWAFGGLMATALALTGASTAARRLKRAQSLADAGVGRRAARPQLRWAALLAVAIVAATSATVLADPPAGSPIAGTAQETTR